MVKDFILLGVRSALLDASDNKKIISFCTLKVSLTHKTPIWSFIRLFPIGQLVFKNT